MAHFAGFFCLPTPLSTGVEDGNGVRFDGNTRVA
jgi:hypothetical protein